MTMTTTANGSRVNVSTQPGPRGSNSVAECMDCGWKSATAFATRAAAQAAAEEHRCAASVGRSFERLAEQAAKELDPTAHLRPLLDAARAAMNEVGIGAARRALQDALDGYTASQAGLRAAQQAEQAAKAAYDDALRDAEWEADDPARFVTEGNKTFLILDVPNDSGEKPRRQVTAEQRRDWVRAQAARDPRVVDAAKVLTAATEATAAARDEMAFAERRLQAVRHDLDAATAQLAALTAAITTRTLR